MPRIRLAHWYDGHIPGDVITVDDDTLRALQGDGRVNEVLPDEPYDNGGFLSPGPSVEVNETGEPEPVEAPPKRPRKASP